MQPLPKDKNKNTKNYFFAHFISILLIPLFAPAYLFAIILFYFPELTPITEINQKVMSILYIFIATTLPPFLLIFVLYKMKKISNMNLHEKKDRVIPQVFSCFNYMLITLFLIYKFGYSNPLTLSMVSITISIIVISIVTHFWKISAHTSGAAGIFTIASVLYIHHPYTHFFFPYITLLLLTVAVCIARIQLKVHTISQVLAGCLLGSLIGFCCFYC